MSAIPWKTLVAGLLTVLSLSFFLNRQHRALADARRDAEAAHLALAQQIVAEQESSGQLRAGLRELTDQNELLRDAYEQAVKSAPDAKPESTSSLVTKPVVVSAKPREPQIAEEDPGVHPPPPPPCDAPLVADGHGGWTCPQSAPKKPAAACVLSAGDLGSFRVDQIVLKTEAGNRLVAGTAEFWRETPAPRSKLAAGAFSSALSDVGTLAAPPAPRWGAEVAGLCVSGHGCGLGGGVLLPPLALAGLRWEARLDAYAGPALAAGGALGVRW